MRSDLDLIAAHCSGDPRAFTELVSRHRDRMWAVALRTMRDPDDAADALQDACISAFRSAAKFRGDSAVTTWLHRIVINACLDRIRRRQARPTVPFPTGNREPATPRDPIADHELTMDLTSALQSLPADQRAAIVLIDVEGYSVSDAATTLGVAEGTVKSRCARGRTKLARQLGHLRNQIAAQRVEGKNVPVPTAVPPIPVPVPAPVSQPVPRPRGGDRP